MLPLVSLAWAALAVSTNARIQHHMFSNTDTWHTSSGMNTRQAAQYAPHTIDMPIDHFPNDNRYSPHTNATFKQYYYFDATHYKPGGPVYLYIGGETDARNRFSNMGTGIIGILMNATGGLGIILENRYYGQSWPVPVSTTDNLAYLSNEQTIADIAYFAQHATFPGVSGNVSLNAPSTPWILYGGSLAGAQTAFAVKSYGDVLYGGIASSAPIHAALEYPEWYDPIQKYGPSDCVAIINNIVDKFDRLVDAGNTAAINEFKGVFGLQALTDNRDFAAAIAFPMGGPMDYPTYSWQELTWRSQSADFWSFCSNATNLDASADITKADYDMAKYTNGEPWEGLGNYAYYIKIAVLPTCRSGDFNSTTCFGTQNKSAWSDTRNGGGRSYLYSTCTEGGLYQAAPKKGKSLISRVLRADYTQDWCNWAFAPGKYNSVPATPDLDLWNKYGGYDLQADRLAFIDGNIDPWVNACYHSDKAPQRYSSDLHPEYLIVGGGHHWDSSGIGNLQAEPQFIREAHLWEIRTVKKWLRDFPKWKTHNA